MRGNYTNYTNHGKTLSRGQGVRKIPSEPRVYQSLWDAKSLNTEGSVDKKPDNHLPFNSPEMRPAEANAHLFTEQCQSGTPLQSDTLIPQQKNLL